MKPDRDTAMTSPLPQDDFAAPPEQPAWPKMRRPSSLRLLVSTHRTQLGPWAWMGAADIVAITGHYATTGLLHQFATAASASAAVSAWGLWRSRDARLKTRIKTARTRRKVQKNVHVALAAGTAWELVATMWTPFGPHGGVQLALLGGGLTIAAPHLWRNRHRPEPVEPIAEIEAPAEDARLTQFRDQFCGAGALREAHLHNLEPINGGFRFHIALSLAYRGTFRDVKALEDQIAALYDVPPDHVSVEPPESRSARRAVVTVLTETNAHEREEPWDGGSTYDPATGCFELGRYADGSRSHWQLHVPYSGAAGGLSIGVIGSGKSGTLHVVAAEAGQAKLCRVCGSDHECPQCDPGRICALWMGDPQRQPFGVWRGRGDLTAWGPLSCVRMLSWMHAALRYRADQFGTMEWADHLGRVHHGKGWFDPTPAMPMVLGVIDEWPIISGDPDLAAYAVPLASDVLQEGRKVGLTLLLGSTEGDVDLLASRDIRQNLTAFNCCVHKTDRYARQMLGIEGNPMDLPPGVPGASYLSGFDRRSGIVQRTKSLREVLRRGESGIDVRAIADRIAADPVTYDEGVLDAIVPLGYTGHRQVLTDDDGWTLEDLHTQTGAEESDPQPAPTGASPTTQTAGPVPASAVSAVHDALHGKANAEVWDLMEATGRSALEVSRALDVLIAQGSAVQERDGRYATCT